MIFNSVYGILLYYGLLKIWAAPQKVCAVLPLYFQRTPANTESAGILALSFSPAGFSIQGGFYHYELISRSLFQRQAVLPGTGHSGRCRQPLDQRLTPVQLDGSTAVFTVQSSFQRAVVLGNYEALLKEAFFNILGFDVTLDIQVKDEPASPAPDEERPAPDFDDIARRHEELEHTFEGANYEYTFDTFIVGGSNEFAYAACTAVAKEPGVNYNPCSSTAPPVWARPT